MYPNCWCPIMKLIFDFKFRFYTSKMNEICLHCHCLFFPSIILSFRQCGHICNMHIFVLCFGINLRIEMNSQIFGNIFIIRESVAQIEFPNTKFVYLKKWLTPNLDLHLYYLLLLRTTISYLSKIALILSLT